MLENISCNSAATDTFQIVSIVIDLQFKKLHLQFRFISDVCCNLIQLQLLHFRLIVINLKIIILNYN